MKMDDKTLFSHMTGRWRDDYADGLAELCKGNESQETFLTSGGSKAMASESSKFAPYAWMANSHLCGVQVNSYGMNIRRQDCDYEEMDFELA